MSGLNDDVAAGLDTFGAGRGREPVSVGAAPALRVLVLGGTGVISSAVVARAVAVGHRVTVLNRGTDTRRPLPGSVDGPGVDRLVADVADPAAVRAALSSRTFDVVADFLCFTAEAARAAVELFAARTGHYLFVSSASAYQKPPARLPVTESTPLRNPFWQYSRDKIACEDVFTAAYRNTGFPVTIVRPSHTYDRTGLPLLGGWTDVHRMRAGLPVLVHGDGTSLWTLTHAADFAVGFAGLLGRPEAIGDSFTITSDEVLPWDAIYRAVGAAAGVPEPRLVHVASETIAANAPALGPGLLGDRAHSVVFDNGKIKALVPDFRARIPFSAGARAIMAWHIDHPEARVVDPAFMDLSDRLAAASLR
ncbi:NAD-dependent epimerase/dehydratase family protein [Specibacter cremeus]|uniref:NAD-dependent epimerase/dehydratase family protein n=1 Tax=Specibacter cremeus TaxID=1629051 RepID=UPI000F798598|nr:NAD-dependent epimerase/dehydratase family protein [Specibacter cremeus]